MDNPQKRSPLHSITNNKVGSYTGGLLNTSALILSLVAISFALFGSAKLIIDIFNQGFAYGSNGIWAKIILLSISFVMGWFLALVCIRGFGNLILPLIINIYTWITLSGVSLLYVKIIQKLYVQQYDSIHYWIYIAMMTAGVAIIFGLSLLIERRDLRPYAIPLLFLNFLQLGLMVYRYLFTTDARILFIFSDLFLFFYVFVFSTTLIIHIDGFKEITKRFPKKHNLPSEISTQQNIQDIPLSKETNVANSTLDKNKPKEATSLLSLVLLLALGVLIIGWGILGESRSLINIGIVALLSLFLFVVFKRDVTLPRTKVNRPYWQRKFLLVFILLTSTALTIGLFMFKAYKTDVEHLKQNGGLDVRVLIDRPSLISPRDTYFVSLIVKNEGVDNVSGTIRLLISPENVICLTEDGKLSNKIEIENLSPKDSLAERFICTSLSAPVNNYINIKVSLNNTQNLSVIESPENQVRAIKIPYFHTALYWLFSGVITSITGLFWEQIKMKYFG